MTLKPRTLSEELHQLKRAWRRLAVTVRAKTNPWAFLAAFYLWLAGFVLIWLFVEP